MNKLLATRRHELRITLDKSFLDGASAKLVGEIFLKHTVLFPEVLFYEMLTTRKESQARCFSKIPATHNPAVLIPDVGSMLRYEFDNFTPCNPVELVALEENFIFNSALANGTYIPDEKTQKDLGIWRNKVEEDTVGFIERCKVVVEYFPKLHGLVGVNLQSAIQAIRQDLASDVNLVRNLYDQIVNEGSPIPVPDAGQIDESWIVYRWVQCHVASALRMYSRTQGSLDFSIGSKAFLRAEHTLHDINHTIIGISVGRIATDDREVVEDVLLFNPRATVVSKNG